MSQLGIVTIGRNEGDRLRRCLCSVVGHDLPVVYVDSNSTDGSVELARSLGAEVVKLDQSRSFTAAWRRNAGFERLRQIAPGIEYVQVVDGDCEVVSGWLASPWQFSKKGPTSLSSSAGAGALSRSDDLQPRGRSRVGRPCGRSQSVRRRCHDPRRGVSPCRRLRSIDHRGRGARVLPADPGPRVESCAYRRQHDAARHGHDPVYAVVEARGAVRARLRRRGSTLRPYPPSVITSARREARSFGDFFCPSSPSAWPGRPMARASCCCAGI